MRVCMYAGVLARLHVCMLVCGDVLYAMYLVHAARLIVSTYPDARTHVLVYFVWLHVRIYLPIHAVHLMFACTYVRPYVLIYFCNEWVNQCTSRWANGSMNG